MIHAIGYACICLGLPGRSISRTVRVANASPERLRELIRANLDDLRAILDYNLRERLCLFRLNQSLIPLISHPANALAWWEAGEFGPWLRELGDYIQAHGLRVSMHPGQYTVLNSENPDVVASSVAELERSCLVLDTMGLPPSHKLVLHGGAGKPSHAEALERFAANWVRLSPTLRARLVLENDDRVFSVASLLPLCRRLGIPLVFDLLHHEANPGAWADRPIYEIMTEVTATWGPQDGFPKVHFSSQDPVKKPGSHAYDLDPQDFLRFRDAMGDLAVDVMTESKGKDLSLIALRKTLGLELAECGK